MRFLLRALVGLVPLVTMAQAAPGIGRLPLLADLPPSGGVCKVANANSGMQREGMVRLTMWHGGSPERLISVSTDRARLPRSLSIMSSVPAGPKRHEGESLFALVDTGGHVSRGNRNYFTTGVPARMSEDRRGGLFPGDSTQILGLAGAVLARCHR